MFVKDKNQAELFDKGNVKVWEYHGSNKLDVALSQIKGKYPVNSKWAVNSECDMMYIVKSGIGIIYFKDKNEGFKIKEDSVVLIPKATPYRVKVTSDKLIVWMPSSPAWSPTQYKGLDE